MPRILLLNKVGHNINWARENNPNRCYSIPCLTARRRGPWSFTYQGKQLARAVKALARKKNQVATHW